MLIRLKDYVRNLKKRKENIHQNEVLLTGVRVKKAKHDASMRFGRCQVIIPVQEFKGRI